MKTMQMTCNGWENFEKLAQTGKTAGDEEGWMVEKSVERP